MALGGRPSLHGGLERVQQAAKLVTAPLGARARGVQDQLCRCECRSDLDQKLALHPHVEHCS